MIVTPSFFESRETVALARKLLGMNLEILASNGTIHSHRITETEAYDGPDDLACHASKGRTARTEVMFGPAGHWYVYLIYGVHEMLNLVTGPEDYPAAILIRGLMEIKGPGRLTKRLGIDRRFNKLPALKKSRLWINDTGFRYPESDIEITPRIGVNYAGPDWSLRPYRFVAKFD